jgi:hypothetical protein
LAEVSLGNAYTVVRRLAVGGMGEVLLAEAKGDPRIGLGAGLVVVKRTIPTHPNRAHQDRMLKEEGRLGLRLRHANLVESFALDEVDNAPLLVMEYLAGRSMAQVLGAAKRGKQMVPVDVALAIVRLSACGLHFAHTLTDGPKQLGLVHRDVSPANIFVTFDGRVKVIDFGVAKADDSEIKTSTGVLKGKIGYMSPEHTRGEVLDPRADVWSLGVFLWEMLVADRLFSTQNPAQALHRINHAPIPAPSTLRADIPRSVDVLVASLLARPKEERVQSCAELVRRIDAIREVQTAKADIANFLCARFPDDAERGIEEALRAARVRTDALPIGLVESADMSDADLDAATVVANRRDLIRMARMSAGRELDNDDGRTVRREAPLSSDLDDSLEGKTVQTAPDRVFDSEMSTDGTGRPGSAATPTSDARPPSSTSVGTADLRGPKPAPVPLVDAPAPPIARAEPADAFAQPASASHRIRRSRVSPVAAALLTFGVLAIAMGAVFASFSAGRPPEALTVAVLVDDNREVVMALVDAPPDKPSRRVTPDDLRFRGGPGRVVTVPPETFAGGLVTSGVAARATLPPTPRARFAAGLPPAILLLGALALALALPSIVLKKRGLLVVRVLLTLGIVALAAVGARKGALTWPGLDVLEAEPAVFDVGAGVAPSGKKP